MTLQPHKSSTLLLRTALALVAGLALTAALPLAAQVTPAFTYQGELRTGGNPANASFDMEFRLFNAVSGGSQIGPLVTRPGVAAVNGLFNVQLDFGPAQFAGDRQWLEVRIKPAGSGSYETLSPRTEMTATPYALGAVAALPNSVTTTSLVDATVQSADIAPGAIGTAQVNSAQVQRRVSGSCAGSQGVQAVAADGSVTCGNFAGGSGTVTSVGTGAGLTGGPITSSGTISVAPGGIGANEINSAQVQRRVSGVCAGTNFVQQVNVDGTVACAPAGAASGWSLSGNAGTDPGVNFIGTTDAQPFVVRTQNEPSLRIEPNVGNGGVVITSNTLGGSSANSLTPGVRGATIGGGGVPADSDPELGSGSPNRITDHYGTVGGGFGNRAGDDAEPLFGAPFATVGGGRGNTANGNASTVGGGWSNTAGESLSTVGGGFFNNASAGSSHIGGGQFNNASGASSSVAGGSSNTASGDDSTVGGGASNNASGAMATIAGGLQNSAGSHAAIGGGMDNVAAGVLSVVAGGRGNIASATDSTVGGGSFNTASGLGSAVGGGGNNAASGRASAVSGGEFNCAGGGYSWAGGKDAKVRPGTDPGSGSCSGLTYPGGSGDQGTFVWADTQGNPLISTADNQFLVRAAGGIWFGTNSSVDFPAPRFINTSTGAHLTHGGTWTNASSRTLKSGFSPVDVTDTLSRVLSLSLTRWQYRASPQEGEHLGPVAEDFHAAFGLGSDGLSISTTDASGVALAAIQGLNAKLEAENAALRTELADLRRMLEAAIAEER